MNGSSRQSIAIVAVAVVLASILAVIPLFGVAYPPFIDLPNHLARIAVLRAGDGSPLLDYYQVHWAVIPNLATDLLLLGASQFMSLALASKLLVALIAVGWIVAPLLLHFAVYRQISIAPIIGAAFVFNRALAMGFMNFTFGTVAVVFAFAAWILLSHRPFVVRLALAAALSAILFFCHLFVASIFVIAVAIWELWPFVRHEQPIAQRLASVAMAILPVGVGTLLTPRVPERYLAEGWPGDIPGFFAGGVIDMSAFLQAGNFWSSLAFIALLIAVIVALFRQADARLGIVCLTLLILLFALPSVLLGGANVDWRMTALICLFVAAWMPFPLRGIRGPIWTTLVLAFLSVQVVAINSIWQRDDAMYQRVRTLLANIPPGSRLAYSALMETAPPGGRTYVYGLSSLLHYGGYAVLEREIVVPYLFARASQQPILVRDEFVQRHAALNSGIAKDVDDVDWPTIVADFDYAMIVVSGTAAPPPTLEPLGSEGPFHLFKVKR